MTQLLQLRLLHCIRLSTVPTHLHILIRITPQQVAQQPRIRYVRWPHNAPDLLHSLQIGAKTAVTAEYFLVDDGGDGQTVEAVGECFPQLDVVAPLALVVKACGGVSAKVRNQIFMLRLAVKQSRTFNFFWVPSTCLEMLGNTFLF